MKNCSSIIILVILIDGRKSIIFFDFDPLMWSHFSFWSTKIVVFILQKVQKFSLCKNWDENHKKVFLIAVPTLGNAMAVFNMASPILSMHFIDNFTCQLWTKCSIKLFVSCGLRIKPFSSET